MPYGCGLCEDAEQATFLITPLTGGDTMAVGNDCAPVALCGMLASYLGIDADKLWAKAEQLVKAGMKAAAKQASEDRAAMAAEGAEDQAAGADGPGDGGPPGPGNPPPPGDGEPTQQAQPAGATS